MERGKNESFSAIQLAKFVIPSILGVLLLMTPLVIDGRQTVLVSIMSKATNVFINDIVPIPLLVVVFLTISTLFALLCKSLVPSFIIKGDIGKKSSTYPGFGPLQGV
ncbi:MAG: hypothetical protein PHU72_08790 [Dethiosulfovibrio sp.]|nr:hypothetical protein [Dethiosulfovibrio sp.]